MFLTFDKIIFLFPNPKSPRPISNSLRVEITVVSLRFNANISSGTDLNRQQQVRNVSSGNFKVNYIGDAEVVHTDLKGSQQL